MTDRINLRIMKARVTYTNPGHLWIYRDVGLAVKDRNHNASAGAVSLCL